MCSSSSGAFDGYERVRPMTQFTLREIKPDDPDYHKPLDVLIEDLAHAESGPHYGDVIITVEDLTDALFYLAEFQRKMKRYKFRRLSK